jgi:hypothetical protein
MSGLELLLSDNRGVYIPRDFADLFSFDNTLTDGWSGVSAEDIEILNAGPDEDCYWEAWDDVLNNAKYTDENKNVWRLWQDGDLWLFCEALMSDEEYENFFGTERN